MTTRAESHSEDSGSDPETDVSPYAATQLSPRAATQNTPRAATDVSAHAPTQVSDHPPKVAPSKRPARRAPSPDAARLDDDRSGDDRYLAIIEHARGGRGRVLRARDNRLDRTVAIKEPIDDSERTRALFAREALITARLQHPGVVPVHDAGHWPAGTPYYVMKLIAGQPLASLIRARRTLRERVALLPCVIDMVETIAYAHSEGIIHRDIKPGNALVGDFGETVVVDWGLARDTRGAVPPLDDLDGWSEFLDATADAVHETVAGRVVGTPAYMAPEQARGEPIDERADVYALGATLYELLCGRRPYGGHNPMRVIERVVSRPPPPLRDRLADGELIPDDLVAIVDKAMARDPDARYQTAKGLAADLHRFQTGKLVSAHDYSAWQIARRWLWRNRLPVAIAAVAIAMLIAVGAMSVRRIISERNTVRQKQGELLFMQAEDSLAQDPTAAVAWLAQAPLHADLPRARRVLDRAAAAGIARHVLRYEDAIEAIAFVGDGALIAAGGDGSLLCIDVDSGQQTSLGRRAAGYRTLAVSPDGAWLAAGAGDGAIELWRLPRPPNKPSDARQTASFRAHDGEVIALQFTANGLLSRGTDEVLRGWSVPDGAPAWSLATPEQAAVDPRGERVARARGAAIEVYEIRTLPDRPTAVKHIATPTPIRRLAFTADGSRLVVRGADSVLRAYPVDGEADNPDLGQVPDAAPFPIASAPGGRWLAAPGPAWSVQLWDLATGTHRLLYGHENYVYALAFAPDGSFLVSAGDDGTARIWHLDSAHVRVLRGHGDDITRLAVSPDGRAIATTSKDRSLRVWPVVEDDGVVLTGVPSSVVAVRFTESRGLISATDHGHIDSWDIRRQSRSSLGVAAPGASLWNRSLDRTGRYAVTMNDDARALELWDRVAGRHAQLAAPAGSVRNIAFSPDSAGLVAVANEPGGGRVSMWRLPGDPGDTSASFALERDSFACGAALSPGAEQLAVVHPTHAAIWDIGTRATTATIPLSGHGSRCRGYASRMMAAYADDGAWLAIADPNRGVVLWDRRHQRAHRFDAGREHTSVLAFSPRGDVLAVANADRAIYLIALRRPESIGAADETSDGSAATASLWPPFRLGRHDDAIWDLAFSPTGQWLASASHDRIVRLWGLYSGRRHALYGHTQSVGTIAFSPDGALLASGSDDQTIRVWSLDDASPLDAAQLRARIETLTTVQIDAAFTARTPQTPAPR